MNPILAKLRQVEDSYVATIPWHESERCGLREGQLLAVDVLPLVVRPFGSWEVREAREKS